jgi:L-threonylcarbamoyladenylate synthase
MSMTKTISPSLTQQVEKAVAILRNGGIIAYPTDTIYGLGADIYNDTAVKRVFTAKNRPLDLPLPVLIGDIEQLEELVANQTSVSRALMKRFWPGGLTIIFNKTPGLRSLAPAGSDKIGVRMPDHEVARLIIRKLGRPMAGTSANLHTGKVTLTADEVKDQLGSRVDYIIDAGPCPGGIESTIVDVTLDPPAVVRQGAIPENEITAVFREKGEK